ncbi:MAG TPA: hypothetical protein VH583_01170 [Vicinamibacterales bacterium]|jgi:hypothetical protein
MTAADAMTGGTDGPRYESRDATVWALVVLGLVLCVVVIFTLFGSGLLVSYFAARQPHAARKAAAAPHAAEPPKPRLQTQPSIDLAEMRRAEDARLHSYAWIDRNAGTVRIPIDRAMDLVASQQLGPQP